jgi:hypothetical protein
VSVRTGRLTRTESRGPHSAVGADENRDFRLFNLLSIAVLVALAALVSATFLDYGITTDEYVQQVYGERLWAFYLSGFTDRSAFHYDNLHLYGGLFDMAAVALQQVLPLGTYEVRHLLCGLTGVLGVAGAWRLGREIGGPRAGFLAAALLALTASWYGAMFNNTKDIPFAVGMTWMLYLTCRIASDLPQPKLRHVLWFGVAAGATLGLRFGGVLGALYLAITVLAHAALTVRQLGWRTAAGNTLRATLALLPAVPVALAVTGFFWPWAILSPLNPVDAVARLTEWPFRTVFGGHDYPANQLPLAYLPWYLAIKIPEVVLLGVLLLLGSGGVALLRRRVRPAGEDPPLLLPVVLAVVVPLAYVLLAQPAFYNGIRHFFFVVPPLCVLAALGLDRLLSVAWAWRRPAGVLAAGLLVAAMMREAAGMHRLHPHQYVYYNALVGGPGGADRRYELDYWSNFVPEAMRELAEHLEAENNGEAPVHRFSVTVCTNQVVLTEYAPDFLVPSPVWEQGDFFISTTNTNCDKSLSGRTIIEITRDGAVLGVVKDRRRGETAQGATTAPAIR